MSEGAKREMTELMIEISEDCYCAYWMDGLERDLWKIVQAGAGRYGQGDITAEEIAELKRLSEQIGAWPTWSDEPDRDFDWVPLNEWKAAHP